MAKDIVKMRPKGLLLMIPLLFLNSVVAIRSELKSQYSADFRSVFDQDLYDSVLNSTLCEQQLRILVRNTLILRFVDASFKIPSGILNGNINDLGDYYQCLGIKEFVNDMQIEGKYCAVIAPLEQENPITIPQLPEFPDFELPFPTLNPGEPDTDDGTDEETDNGTDEGTDEGTDNGTAEETEARIVKQYDAIRRYAMAITGLGDPVESRISPLVITSTMGPILGVCIPKVCTATEAIKFFQDQVYFFNFTFTEFFYRLPNDKLFSPADYVATVIFSLLGFLIIVCTSYDLCHIFWFKRDPKSANTLYRSFSVYTNTRRFLTFNTYPGALECVDGIRAISMLWVVVGHTYAFSLITFIHNAVDIVPLMTKFSSIWVNSAPITVDTFFCLSGILVVYTTIGKISRARFIRTIHLFYINRILRIFPILAVVILLQASFFNHLSDGPFWNNVSQQTQNCRTWWWAALLHVQNYVNPLEICLPQTWYLSVDVQLYIFCPIIMVCLFGREMIAWIALVGIVIISLISSSVYSFNYNFTAALFNFSRLGEITDYVTVYYINTLTRAPPFFIGMIYGYLLHLYRNKTLKISKINATVLWILSFAMMAFCIFSVYPVMQIDHDAQIFDNILNAYMRAIWACAIGWLIFACVHGYGGPIDWFLSLQMWKLPARLSMATYMVHVSLILIANGSFMKTLYFSEGNNLYRFFSDVTMTFIVAFILCITIDAPFSTLQKLLTGGGKKPRKPKTESRENIIEDESPVIKTNL